MRFPRSGQGVRAIVREGSVSEELPSFVESYAVIAEALYTKL